MNTLVILSVVGVAFVVVLAVELFGWLVARRENKRIVEMTADERFNYQNDMRKEQM